jgi:Ca2+-binding EF-hand superfamily protein
MPSAEEVFKRIDKNGDGVISKQEFMAAYAEFQKKIRNRQGQGPVGPGAAGPVAAGRPNLDRLLSHIDAVFSRFDKNKDGKLTKDEVPAAVWERISKADANHDGAVTKEELKAAFQKRIQEEKKKQAK